MLSHESISTQSIHENAVNSNKYPGTTFTTSANHTKNHIQKSKNNRKKIQSKNSSLNELSILLIGDEQVGKSTLLSVFRFITHDQMIPYDQLKEYDATIEDAITFQYYPPQDHEKASSSSRLSSRSSFYSRSSLDANDPSITPQEDKHLKKSSWKSFESLKSTLERMKDQQKTQKPQRQEGTESENNKKEEDDGDDAKKSEGKPKEQENNSPIALTCMEVGGNASYQTLLPSAIESADAFILVYDVNRKSTFENIWSIFKLIVQTKWKRSDDLPIVLVANKMDSIDDENRVSLKKGKEFAQVLRVPLFPCSWKAPWVISECFQNIISQARSKPIHPKKVLIVQKRNKQESDQPFHDSQEDQFQNFCPSHHRSLHRKSHSSSSLLDSKRTKQFTDQYCNNNTYHKKSSSLSSIITNQQPLNSHHLSLMPDKFVPAPFPFLPLTPPSLSSIYPFCEASLSSRYSSVSQQNQKVEKSLNQIIQNDSNVCNTLPGIDKIANSNDVSVPSSIQPSNSLQNIAHRRCNSESQNISHISIKDHLQLPDLKDKTNPNLELLELCGPKYVCEQTQTSPPLLRLKPVKDACNSPFLTLTTTSTQSEIVNEQKNQVKERPTSSDSTMTMDSDKFNSQSSIENLVEQKIENKHSSKLKRTFKVHENLDKLLLELESFQEQLTIGIETQTEPFHSNSNEINQQEVPISESESDVLVNENQLAEELNSLNESSKNRMDCSFNGNHNNNHHGHVRSINHDSTSLVSKESFSITSLSGFRSSIAQAPDFKHHSNIVHLVPLPVSLPKAPSSS